MADISDICFAVLHSGSDGGLGLSQYRGEVAEFSVELIKSHSAENVPWIDFIGYSRDSDESVVDVNVHGRFRLLGLRTNLFRAWLCVGALESRAMAKVWRFCRQGIRAAKVRNSAAMDMRRE